MSYIPLWVPFVFVLLVALGMWQRRSRVVPPRTLLILPIVMAVFSLYGIVSSFGVSPVAISAWGVGMLLSIVVLTRLFAATRPAKDSVEGRVEIPGSWMPLVVFLSIFAVKFVLGFATGTHAAFVGEVWFVASAAIVLGMLSGSFAGRALGLWRAAGRRGELTAIGSAGAAVGDYRLFNTQACAATTN